MIAEFCFKENKVNYLKIELQSNISVKLQNNNNNNNNNNNHNFAQTKGKRFTESTVKYTSATGYISCYVQTLHTCNGSKREHGVGGCPRGGGRYR